jgi:hypothetical protein
MSKTAMQWLYDELAQCLHREEVCDLVYKLEQKAKEMEREQIESTFRDAQVFAIMQYPISDIQYYEQRYEGHNE